MATTFGLTTEGFVPMTLLDARDDLRQRIWKAIAPTLDLTDRSLEGQIVGIISELLHKVWALAEVLSSGMDRNKATGAALDALAVLIGTFRAGASASVATLTLTGTPTTLVPAGSGATVASDEAPRFNTDDDATIAAVTAWAPSTVYAIGDRRTNAGKIYQCVDAGESANSGGPTGTDPLVVIVDYFAGWRFLGTGTGAVDVTATATVTGPTVANSGTITQIATPLGGWLGVVNVLDAAPGRTQMTDAELRAAMELEVARQGTSPKNAIRADLLDVPGVTSVTVFSNRTDTTDADGLPPHSIEALVVGGDDTAILEQLADSVADGIGTYSGAPGAYKVEGLVLDDVGNPETMMFSRAVEVPIYVDVDVVVEAGVFPADGIDQVKQAIVTWGDAQRTGKDAVASALVAQTFKVAGVLDASVVIDDAPGPSSDATIPINVRSLATYDTSRINVNVTTATP